MPRRGRNNTSCLPGRAAFAERAVSCAARGGGTPTATADTSPRAPNLGGAVPTGPAQLLHHLRLPGGKGRKGNSQGEGSVRVKSRLSGAGAPARVRLAQSLPGEPGTSCCQHVPARHKTRSWPRRIATGLAKLGHFLPTRWECWENTHTPLQGALYRPAPDLPVTSSRNRATGSC